MGFAVGGLVRVPNATDDGYNIAAPGANTNIITGIAPKLGAGIFRIGLALATASVFNYTVTDGTTGFTVGLYASAALTAGDQYLLDIPHLGPSYTYNFQVETDGIVRVLTVHELPPDQA